MSGPDDGTRAGTDRTPLRQGLRTPRRRKAPRHTEWRGETLYGRIRIQGKLTRWSLRTGDVELARTRVEEDIAQMKAAAFYGDQRIRYQDMVASWAEKHIVHEVGPNTAKRYAVSLRQLEPFLIDAFMDQIDKAKISEIVDARRADGAATATIRRDLTALSSVLIYAEVDDNPALARLKKLTERREPIVLPEPDAIETVIARAPAMIGALIRVAWGTGCRLEELVTADRRKLDHTRRQLTVIGKGNKLRVIDLDFGDTYEVLRKVPPFIGCNHIFWHPSPIVENGRTVGQRAAHYANLSSRFAALTADIEAKVKDFSPFRFHDLRHRHAVDWLKAGRSIYDLQQRLGHASIKTTEIYLKFLTPEEKRAAMYGAANAASADQRGAS